MCKVVCFISFIVLLCNVASAGLWTLKTSVELVDPQEKKFKIKRSVLNFSSGAGQVKRYSPKSPPWGFYKSKEVLSSGQAYFITYWAAGNQNVHFKIFNPSESADPICEFTSDAEQTRLRHVNKKLEYEMTERISLTQFKKSWRKCTRTVSSV